MKRNIFLSTSFFLLLAFSLLLPSCLEDLPENTPVSPGQSLRIRVDDSGFTPVSQTRAQETDYQTVFTAGDQIGVFAVKGSEILPGINNLCLTATASSSGELTWAQDAGSNVELFTDVTYYAYYPWQGSLTGNLVPTANNAADFFANVITNWTPAADQSDYAKYTAQDLMIADGSLSGKNLTFSMAHQMSLVVIELPRTKYTFNNTPAIPEYIIDAPDMELQFKPCFISAGNYRYLVNASNELSGSYTNAGNTNVSWAFTPSASAGNFKIYKVDGGNNTTIAKSHTLQMGDFFMKDGSLVGKDVSLTPNQKAACIGIVLKAGKDDAGDWKDDCVYKQKDGITPMPTIHGYVLALNEANGGNACIWSPSEPERSVIYIVDGVDMMNREETTGFYGYKNTQAIILFNREQNGTLSSAFPAAYYATDYETSSAAPAASSGWFLPSAGQCLYWNHNLVALLTLVQAVTGNGAFSWNESWASSEYGSYGDTAGCMKFEQEVDNGYHSLKYVELNVRSCLAF